MRSRRGAVATSLASASSAVLGWLAVFTTGPFLLQSPRRVLAVPLRGSRGAPAKQAARSLRDLRRTRVGAHYRAQLEKAHAALLALVLAHHGEETELTHADGANHWLGLYVQSIYDERRLPLSHARDGICPVEDKRGR